MKVKNTAELKVGETLMNDHSEILLRGVTKEIITPEVDKKDLLIKLGKGNKPRSCGKPASFMSNIGKFYQRIVYCGKHNCPRVECHADWVKEHAKIIDGRLKAIETKEPQWHYSEFQIRLNHDVHTKQEADALYKATEEFVRLKTGHYALVYRQIFEAKTIGGSDVQYMVVKIHSAIPFLAHNEPVPMDFEPLPHYSTKALLTHSLKAFRMKAYRFSGLGHVCEKKTKKIDPLSRADSKIKRRAKELRNNGIKISRADIIHVRDGGIIDPDLGDYGVRLYGSLWRTDLVSWMYLHFGSWEA